jgi:hypothetical protein
VGASPPRLRPLRVAGSGAAAAIVVAGICAAFAFGSIPAIRTVDYQAKVIDYVADLNARLARSVRHAGGAEAVVRCGHPWTPWWTVTPLAWDLDVAPTYVRMMPENEVRQAHLRSGPARSRHHARSSRRRSHRRRSHRHNSLLRPSCRHGRV